MKVKFVEISKKEYLCIIVDGGVLGDISLFARQNFKVSMREEYCSLTSDRRLKIFTIDDDQEITNETINGIEDYILGLK